MNVLIFFVLILLLLALLVVWVGFASSMVLTSRYELKKKAQAGDSKAKIIYGLTAAGRQVYVALLFGTILAIALLALLLDSIMPSVVAALVTTFLAGLFGIVFPFLYGEKLGLNVTAKMAPLAAKLLTLTKPITQPIANKIDDTIGKKSLLYSKEQLLHIIDDHTKSPYSDISSDEARLIRHSLAFGEKKISDVMIPRNVVSTVSEDDQLGPLVMDELHKSGHSRFPVYSKENPDNIVGILLLRDLIGDKRSGRVADLMSKRVYFVHEELDLNHALHAFISTKRHMFIVVNNFEEYVGILTIEDVLEQILGRQIVDEFDNYENLREVAALRAKKQAKSNHHV